MHQRAAWLQAIDAQIEQYLWLSSGAAGRRAVRREPGGSDAPADPGISQHQFDVEIGKLLNGDPVFVTAEMCDLVEAAAATFRPEPLFEHDLMTPMGFLLFERPLELLEEGEPLPGEPAIMTYAGFSWAGIQWPADAAEPYCVHFSFYTSWNATNPAGRLPSEPDLLLFESLDVWLNREPLANQLERLRLIETTLRLMREFRPASRYSTRERPDRATRKRARRAGLPEREIHVVRLRREQSPSERIGGAVNYSHRFVVSGHWRNQWYPSLSAHRQTWISPYVKGPDDKPFRPPRRRIFNFDR